jgi:glycosyltransferase involved in cell wall biosynthesis
MRIVQLTPGTGNFHCGSCLRDAAMVQELRRMGHDVLMVPLYLPPVVDGPDPSQGVPIFFGGINVYLQNKSALFRHTPAWLDRLLDRPSLLRKAADRSGMTAARDLGELTLSMLCGEEGRQNKELTKLMDFLRGGPRPDVVCLSNAMLIGLARRIKRDLGCRLVCTLAGEDGFLDTLIPPYRDRAWNLLRDRAADVDAFIAVSRYYADAMIDRGSLPPARIHVVHNGIAPQAFGPPAPPTVPTVGYMARLHPAKGLGTLIEAFMRIRQNRRVPDARLHIAGAQTPADDSYVAQQRQRIEEAGLSPHVHWETNIDAARKRQFLSGLSVLSVPAIYGEAFGLYILEAWASGVPVVQPRHAAFVELLEQTGGGMLCEPADPAALAATIEELLLNPAAASAMGLKGRQAVLEYFNLERMTRQIVEVFEGSGATSRTDLRVPS